MYGLMLFLVILALSNAETITKVALPVGGSTSFLCQDDSIAMWSKEGNDGSVIQIAAGTFALKGVVDSSRFLFSQKSNDFIMEINDIRPDDGGKYVCNNRKEFHLIVISPPQCLPAINTLREDEHYSFSCSASVSQFGEEKEISSRWRLGDDDLYGEVNPAADSFVSSLPYTAKYLDHGKQLSCSLTHPNWDAKFPAPSCSFERFNVQFEPKIDCPSEKLFFPSDSEFLIRCSIVGNPLPGVADIQWNFEKNRERRKFPSFTQKGNSIVAALKLTKHHLSVRNSDLRVTLKVPNKLGATPFASKEILARYVHGPDIACAKNVVVEPRKASAVKISCDVHVNPTPPNSNISWYVDDDFIQRQRSELTEKIPNGVRVAMELDADQYGKEALKVTLKISGLIAARGEIVHVSVPHMQSDERPRRVDGAGKEDSFVSGNAGLMLLGAGTLFLMILTVVVAFVFYRKGFFSSNESQYGTRAVIAQGTMADSDFFGIADKGFDAGTFQFYQPKNTVDPHGTMTMKLMKRIKESDRDSEWTDGFAKMANALYLKDTDQDGYLTVMEAKPVVMSYSDIYHLGISESKLDEVFCQCSNGQHVDVETLLRMISIPSV